MGLYLALHVFVIALVLVLRLLLLRLAVEVIGDLDLTRLSLFLGLALLGTDGDVNWRVALILLLFLHLLVRNLRLASILPYHYSLVILTSSHKDALAVVAITWHELSASHVAYVASFQICASLLWQVGGVAEESGSANSVTHTEQLLIIGDGDRRYVILLEFRGYILSL
jgi:hypothetical protein